jgi:hypothetical protein
MLNEMSASEHAAWQAYFSIEPMPAARADIRSAEIMRAVLYAAGAKSVPALSRLVPDYWRERAPGERQAPQQIESTMRLIFAARRKPNDHDSR